MTDFKSMYYHLAGRTASAIDVLEATTSIMEANAKSMKATVESMMATAESMMATTESLVNLKEKLKLAQQETEELFIGVEDDD